MLAMVAGQGNRSVTQLTGNHQLCGNWGRGFMRRSYVIAPSRRWIGSIKVCVGRVSWWRWGVGGATIDQVVSWHRNSLRWWSTIGRTAVITVLLHRCARRRRGLPVATQNQLQYCLDAKFKVEEMTASSPVYLISFEGWLLHFLLVPQVPSMQATVYAVNLGLWSMYVVYFCTDDFTSIGDKATDCAYTQTLAGNDCLKFKLHRIVCRINWRKFLREIAADVHVCWFF